MDAEERANNKKAEEDEYQENGLSADSTTATTRGWVHESIHRW